MKDKINCYDINIMKEKNNNSTSFIKLIEIMKKLLDPEGCPWDREQTHQSLKPYLIEEAYEFFEAIDNKNKEEMKEELGDLLLQIVFHSELASRMGNFTIEDVIEGICNKLIHRHPHVFGDLDVKSSQEVLENWENIKKREKNRKKQSKNSSVLDGIPKNMPSLTLASRIQERASNVGFDWDNILDVWAKVKEEYNELHIELNKGNSEKIEEEFGDLIFALVNLFRFLKINPEYALRKSVMKFDQRFRYIEEKARENGQNLKDMSLSEMDKYWNESKI